MSEQQDQAELKKVRLEQARLHKKLDVAAEAITGLRIELQKDWPFHLSPEEVKHAKLEQRRYELEAAAIQRRYLAGFRREESLMKKLGLWRDGASTSHDQSCVAVGRKQQKQWVAKDEVTEAKETVKALKEHCKDLRVDRTYTKMVLETAEREAQRGRFRSR